MQKFFNKNFNKKLLEENYKELRVKEYINKYIKELQRHFDMSDKKMRSILYKVYRELSPISFIKSWIYVLKSNYRKWKIKNRLKGNLNEG